MASAFTAPLALDAALAYAGRRWFVFPLVERGKRPATRHGLLDATTDLELVERWWRARPHANVGIACEPSGLLVVDLDRDEAQGTWADLAARDSGHEQTLVAVTGKPGGLHLYFAAATVPRAPGGSAPGSTPAAAAATSAHRRRCTRAAAATCGE